MQNSVRVNLSLKRILTKPFIVRKPEPPQPLIVNKPWSSPSFLVNNNTQPLSDKDIFNNIQYLLNNATLISTPTYKPYRVLDGYLDEDFKERVNNNYDIIKKTYNVDMSKLYPSLEYRYNFDDLRTRGCVLVYENKLAEIVLYGSGRPYINHMVVLLE